MTENENTEEEQENWDSNVKGRQRLFVLFYCTDDVCLFNQSEAYRKAYSKKDKRTGNLEEPSDTTCQTNASRLMKQRNVRIAIKRLLKLAQADIDDEMVYKLLKEMALGATYNPADILDKNGKLVCKKLEDLGENAKMIAQITPTKFGTQYTLVNRSKYIEMLAKYFQLVKPETQVDIKLPVIEVTPKFADDANGTAVEKWNLAAEKQCKE